MTILIYDYDGNLEGYITTEVTQPEDIEKIIAEIKENNPDGYTDDDLVMNLPGDCKITWISDTDFGNAVYW